MAISDKEFYEVKADVQSHSKEIGDLNTRMGDVERKQETLYEMNKNIALMAQSLKQVEGDVGEVKTTQKELADKVSTLENQPAKDTVARITSVKWSIISAVCGAVGMGLFALIVEQLNK